jgi:hypothetical protein
MSDVAENDQLAGILAAFDDHIDALAEQHGVDLSDEDREWLFDQTLEHGFTPGMAERVFTAGLEHPEQDDSEQDPQAEQDVARLEQMDERIESGMAAMAQDLEHDVDRLAAKLGRTLIGEEIEAIGQAAVDHINRHTTKRLPADFAEKALEEHQGHSAEPRSDHGESMDRVERMAKRIQAMQDDDPANDELNLDNPRDRAVYLADRVRGVEYEEAEEADIPETEEAA